MAGPPLLPLMAGVTFFLSLGFSVFLYLGYRLAPVQQNRLLLIVGAAFAATAVIEFLDLYGVFQPVETSVVFLPVASFFREVILLVVSLVLFWYSYSTYYFIIKSSPEKKPS